MRIITTREYQKILRKIVTQYAWIGSIVMDEPQPVPDEKDVFKMRIEYKITRQLFPENPDQIISHVFYVRVRGGMVTL